MSQSSPGAARKNPSLTMLLLPCCYFCAVQKLTVDIFNHFFGHADADTHQNLPVLSGNWGLYNEESTSTTASSECMDRMDLNEG